MCNSTNKLIVQHGNRLCYVLPVQHISCMCSTTFSYIPHQFLHQEHLFTHNIKKKTNIRGNSMNETKEEDIYVPKPNSENQFVKKRHLAMLMNED